MNMPSRFTSLKVVVFNDLFDKIGMVEQLIKINVQQYNEGTSKPRNEDDWYITKCINYENYG